SPQVDTLDRASMAVTSDTPIPQRIAAIRVSFDRLRESTDPEALAASVAELEGQMQVDGFWDDPAAAAKVNTEYARTTRKLKTYTDLSSDIEDLDGLVELADEDDELASELDEQLASVESRLSELEEERLFSG